LDQVINQTGLAVFDLNPKIAAESCSLPGDFHKNPSDRIIVATARVMTTGVAGGLITPYKGIVTDTP
jgi:PIN domain nuclease of toxin-antitoxin system